ncbi:MAG: hypothetical protein K6E47_14355 [Lachnospiraceae bacterium]|nr:hypothetical protein [Lachnospiraceae bacterium]
MAMQIMIKIIPDWRGVNLCLGMIRYRWFFSLRIKTEKSKGLKRDEQDNATAGGRIQNGERKYRFGE